MIDDLLLGACKNGDEKSWQQLFKSLYPIAKWVVRRRLCLVEEGVVEEIAQETMVAVVPKIIGVNDGEHLERIVRRMARNKSIDYLRRNNITFEELSDDCAAPMSESVEDEVIVALRRAFQKLGELCKGIIRSRFFSEKSYKEIADEIDVDVNQVGIRISRCLVRLRTLLSAEHIQAEDVL